MTDMDVPPAGGYQFPMVRYTDMEEDMKKDVSLRNIWFGKDSMLKVLSWKRMWNLTELQVMEICNSACDNHAANNELCAKNIKVQKHNHTTKSNWSKFPGSSWQEVWPKLARNCGRGIWIWDQLRDQENVLHVFCRQGPILTDNFLINQPKLSLESAKTVFWLLQDAPLCVYGSARDFILLCNACKIKLNVDIFYCFSVQQIRSSIFCRHVKIIWDWNVAWDKRLLVFWPLEGDIQVQ